MLISKINFINMILEHPTSLWFFLIFFLSNKFELVHKFFFFKNIYISIIAEAERKWIPIIKEVVTNRIKKQYIMLFGIVAHRLKAINYNFSLR